MSKNNKSNENGELNRSKVIIKSGWLFILVNFLLALFNMIVGLLSNSLAIVSDATHSLIDSVSGILIIGSEKLANYRKFVEKREKIERITTIIIAIIIIAVGIHIIIESIEKILEPEAVEFSIPAVIVLVASIAMKYALAIYLKKNGEKLKSDVLKASGVETMNDAWISVAVLLSVLFYLIWQVDVEAYISIVIAFVIIKIGLEFIFPHISHHHHHPLDAHPDHDYCGKN